MPGAYQAREVGRSLEATDSSRARAGENCDENIKIKNHTHIARYNIRLKERRSCALAACCYTLYKRTLPQRVPRLRHVHKRTSQRSSDTEHADGLLRYLQAATVVAATALTKQPSRPPLPVQEQGRGQRFRKQSATNLTR